MVDEGYDLPDIDAAMIVASSKSERQRIQRAGRVLRRGDGTKKPLVLTFFCQGTPDVYVVQNDRELFSSKSEVKQLSLKEACNGI